MSNTWFGAGHRQGVYLVRVIAEDKAFCDFSCHRLIELNSVASKT